MRRILILLLFIFCIPFGFAQIVNIEGQRYKTDTTGWKGEFNVGFVFGKQKDKYFAFSSNAHVQYKSKKSLYLLLGSLSIFKTSHEELINGGFFHFRYNYKIKKWLRWEAFTQVQYNKLVGIRMRYLIGTGPRFKLAENKVFKGYLGTLYMLEYEINNDKTQKLVEGRFSGYFSFSLEPTKNIEIVSTTYFQPKFELTKDFRVSTENRIDFMFHKFLSFGLNYKLTYDSKPPEGASTKLFYNLENTFKVRF
ncbi:MAG: DUF481 domain-containing protein [Chitinophagales bacterium]